MLKMASGRLLFLALNYAHTLITELLAELVDSFQIGTIYVPAIYVASQYCHSGFSACKMLIICKVYLSGCRSVIEEL